MNSPLYNIMHFNFYTTVYDLNLFGLICTWLFSLLFVGSYTTSPRANDAVTGVALTSGAWLLLAPATALL